MSKLSTHVLDTANGHPAAGMKIDFVRNPGPQEQHLKSFVTNDDGRTDELLLDADQMVEGEYELRFDVGDYFSGLSEKASQPGFLNVVPIRFTITNASEGYHVPLLCSPWSFSTYRGS